MTFSSRFKDNARVGLRGFRKPTVWWIRFVLIMALPIAPLFWAWFALFDKDSS